MQVGEVIQTMHGLCEVVDIQGNRVILKVAGKMILKEEDIRNQKSWIAVNNIYNVTIQSPFLLTQTQLKQKLGIGFKVLSLETEKDLPNVTITDTDSAIEAIIRVGYRALARANHPDLGGDPEVMVILNKSKKEILELLESLK